MRKPTVAGTFEEIDRVLQAHTHVLGNVKRFLAMAELNANENPEVAHRHLAQALASEISLPDDLRCAGTLARRWFPGDNRYKFV